MIHDLASLETYAFADPASGKNRGPLKKQRARQAITVVSCDSLLRIFVRYAWAGREHPSTYRDRIVEVFGQFRPKRFGIESNAMQSLFGSQVLEKCRERWHTCTGMMEWETPNKIEKTWKIRTVLQPLLNEGRLFLMEDMVELIAELQGFPTYHLRDLADCLAMNVMLLPRKFISLMHSADTDTQAVLKYLRDSGAPARAIEQKLRELQAERETESMEMLSAVPRDRAREEFRDRMRLQ